MSFDSEFAEHHSFVLRVARDLVGDAHRAEDLSQEAWLARIASPPPDPSRPRAWLSRVVRNLASKSLQREGHRAHTEHEASRSEVGELDRYDERAAVQARIARAVLSLDEPYRMAVYLRYYEGLAPIAIAERLELPIGTVKTRLHRALGQLRETLEREDGDERGAWRRALVPWIESAPESANESPLHSTPKSAGGWRGAPWKLAAAASVVAGLGVALTGALASSAEALGQETFVDDDFETIEEVRLFGTVRGSDGAPVSGADVFLSTYDRRNLLKLEGFVYDSMRTGDDGRFVVKAPLVGTDIPEWSQLTLWAWAPGHGLLDAGYTVDDLPVGRDLVLALAAPPESRLRVLDPQGEPVAGAAIRPVQLASSPPVPLPLREKLAERTDAQGWARSPGVDGERLSSIQIDAPGYGVQRVTGLDQKKPRADAIGLLPVAALRGRLTCERPELVKGVKIDLSTLFVTDRDATGIYAKQVGLATVTTDADGRFALPALGVGSLTSEISLADPSFGLQYTHVELEPGETHELELALEARVEASGVVREADGEPIAGAVLFGYSWGAGQVAVSDEQGRYLMWVHPGKALSLGVWGLERDYTGRRDLAERMTTARFEEDAESFELPTFQLERGIRCRGRVLDSDGAPAAGAWVVAEWQHAPNLQGASDIDRMRMRNGSRRRSLAVCDEDGQFALVGVDRDALLSISAAHGFARTNEPVQLVPVPGRPVVITVSEDGNVSLRSRVLGADGSPVVGAELEVWRLDNPRLRGGGDPVDFPGRSEIVTQADGSFETPRTCRRNELHAVAIRGEDGIPRWSRWYVPEELADGQLPSLRWTGTKQVSGRVVDAAGNPVRHARLVGVLDAVRGDEHGGFELRVPLGVESPVSVDAPGHATSGHWLEPSADAVRIGLRPERDSAADQVLPSEREAELRLAHALLGDDPLGSLAQGSERERSMLLRAMASFEPRETIRHVDEGSVADSFLRNRVRLDALEALLAAERFDESFAVIETMDTGNWRASAYLAVFSALPPEQRTRRLALLSEARLHSRACSEPETRLIHTARIARHLAEQGLPGPADEVFAEARELAEQLPEAEFAGYARCVLAESLGVVDAGAAFEMLEPLKDPFDRGRHFGNLAHLLAGRAPAAAERAYAEALGRSSTDRYGARICYRMAPVDLGRAERLAAAIRSPTDQAQARGVMAAAIADANPERARELMDQAFRDLRHLRAEDGYWVVGPRSASVHAAALLPVVEQVMPERLDEFVWKTLALVPTAKHARSPADADRLAEGRAATAVLVSRFHPRLAKALLAPAVERFEAIGGGGQDYLSDWRGTLAALVLVAPELAEEWARADRLSTDARLRMLHVLASTGQARWDYIQDRCLSLWTIDREDV